MYRDDPTSHNLDRFAEKWKARLMTDGGKKLVATKQKLKPPFWLNHTNVAKLNGHLLSLRKRLLKI